MNQTIEVPHEVNSTLDGVQKVMYAKNTQGGFERFNYGSAVEEFATKTAIEEYNLLEEECLSDIRKGIVSPIKYFMYKNRMDLETLASAIGRFQFLVKRDFSSKVFSKMDDKLLLKYAEVFNITPDELRNFQ